MFEMTPVICKNVKALEAHEWKCRSEQILSLIYPWPWILYFSITDRMCNKNAPISLSWIVTRKAGISIHEMDEYLMRIDWFGGPRPANDEAMLSWHGVYFTPPSTLPLP